MSYRGRPSKGCETCRARKVKCDEAKPTCGRCSKSGHQCKYRDQADLVFRNQTAFAAQKAEESWRQRSKAKHTLSESSSRGSQGRGSRSPSLGSTSTETTRMRSSSRTQTNPPVPDFNTLVITPAAKEDELGRKAYERFVYDFVIYEDANIAGGEPENGFWDWLPPIYERAAEGSCLKLTVRAVAYANFSTRCNVPSVRGLADESLGKALKLLQGQLADKSSAMKDETLAAVYLMGVYESISSPQRDGSVLAHSAGANALLGMRSAREYLSSPISSQLYKNAFMQMLVNCLQAAKTPSIPIQQLVAARQESPDRYSAQGIYLVQLIHNVACLHAKWHNLKYSSNPPSTRQHLQSLLRESLNLDAEYQTWENTLPAAWRHTAQPNTHEVRATYQGPWVNIIMGSRGAPTEIHAFATMKRCILLMTIRCARLYLLRDLIEMLNWASRLPQFSPSRSGSPFDPPSPPHSRYTSTLDDVSIQIQHTFATTQLVNLIEQNCSMILGFFSVPIPGRFSYDVPGMRGYNAFWCLGIMDAALRLGLVPDSTIRSAPEAYMAPVSDSHGFYSMTAQAAFPSPSVYQDAASDMHSMYHGHINTMQDPHDFPRIDPVPIPYHHEAHVHHPEIHVSPPPAQFVLHSTPSQPEFQIHAQSPPHHHEYHPMNSPLPSPMQSPRLMDPVDGKHVYDLEPPHPFDTTPQLSQADFTMQQIPGIDVGRRREWLHRVMYYISSELGVKKGLSAVALEGYLEKSRASVESLLGRRTEPNFENTESVIVPGFGMGLGSGPQMYWN